MRKLVLLFGFLLAALTTQAQGREPIQLHGVVVSNDSLVQLLPNVQILVKSRGQINMSDVEFI